MVENSENGFVSETKDGKIKFNMENDIVKGCLLTHKNKITHEMTRNIIEGAK